MPGRVSAASEIDKFDGPSPFFAFDFVLPQIAPIVLRAQNVCSFAACPLPAGEQRRRT